MTATAPKPLTPVRAKLLRWIAAYIDAHGYSPTFREMCAAFKWGSTNAATNHLNALERDGYITRLNNQARTIRPTEVPHV